MTQLLTPTLDLLSFERPAAAVQDLLITRLQDARGVHLNTAISGIAAVAGCLLLRATGVPLENLKPGAAVFVDAADAAGAEHFKFLSTVCANLGLDVQGGWTDLIPEEHEPRKTVPELTRMLEGPFSEMCSRFAVPASEYPRLALYTAARLIRLGRDEQILAPAIGKALALNALVAGTKTIPASLSKSRHVE